MTARRLAAVAACLAVATTAVAAGCSDEDGPAASAPTATAAAPTSPADVERWQRQLTAVGCYGGAVDGSEGPETEEAIRSFETASGLAADGRMDPQTAAALSDAADAGRAVCAAPAAAGGTDAEVALSAGPYGASFDVESCTAGAGAGDLTLRARSDDLSLALDAQGGTGSLAVSGGTGQGALDLSGDVTRVTVARDGTVTATGRVSGGDLDGQAFTLSGSCPT